MCIEKIEDIGLNGYKIIQKADGNKFGLDAVILSEFAKVKKDETCVDLCSGYGIIPILLCAKTNAKKIYGVEILDFVANTATKSFELCNITDRAGMINCDLKNVEQYLQKSSFDVVTVNPPYKEKGAGLECESFEHKVARTEELCTLEDVIMAARKLLKPQGRLYMIHRPERLCEIFELLRKYRLEPKKIRMVHGKLAKGAELVLIECKSGAKGKLVVEPPLIITNENGTETFEIKKIYRREYED